MADFWIRDHASRVLGPVGLAVLRDLIEAGRLAGIEAVSRDGIDFKPVSEVVEVAYLLAREAKRQDDKIEAERISERMETLRGKSPHDVFELPPSATLQDFRDAFFRLAKQYHPDRLHEHATPELRLAYDALFHFLGQTMAVVEKSLPATPPPKPPAPSPKPASAVLPEEFVGLKPATDGRVQVEVQVTIANAGMFTEHELVNLAREGVFLPPTLRLPLGSTIDLKFHFTNPARVIALRGRVIFENAASGRGRAGIGVKFLNLRDEDKLFLATFVRFAQQQRENAQPR